jgi:hypothetical protein
MNLQVFPKALIFFIALAFIIYGISPYTNTWDLVKLMAVAFGLSLLSPFLYPHIRGIKKGDTVQLVFEEQTPFQIFYGNSTGVARESGRVGNEIRVELSDGSEEGCVIISYAGIFSPAKVKVMQKEIDVV